MLRGEDRAKPKAETEDERRVKDFIQSAAIRARMQVKYVDRPLVQKAYYKDGVIYINKNRPLDESVKVTVAHELYHAMEGTKEHDTIVRLAFEGKDAEAMIAEKIEKYRQSGVELDETGARAEIGAEFIEKALTDEATINQVLLEDRTLAAKILERINELIDEYGRIKPGMNPREDVAIPKQVNDWDKARRFVRTAMESENVSAEAKDKIADSLASDIRDGKFVYEPVSNQKLQEKANANIAKVGYEKSKAEIFAKYQKNERIKAEDVATLEQLIVKASAEGKGDEVMNKIGFAAKKVH